MNEPGALHIEVTHIEVTPAEAIESFVEYLHRLGCRVRRGVHGCLVVSVAYPETVEDEVASLREWCDSWMRTDRSTLIITELGTV